MKARHIKKLRKQIANFKEYKVRQTAGLFGDFFGENRFKIINPDYSVKASNHFHALTRFFRFYERKNKMKNEYYSELPKETTHRYGKFMVEDCSTGFKRFYW